MHELLTTTVTDRSEEMPKVVLPLLSDFHLQTEDSILKNVFNTKLERAINDLNQLQPTPAFWIINGDITDHGDPRELDAFAEITKRVKPEMSFRVTTGNHEFLGDWEALIPKWKTMFGLKDLYHHGRIAGVHFVLLANEWRSDGSGADCWITQKQIAWFRSVLDDPQWREMDTVVFMHQPLPGTVTPARNDQHLCRNQEEELLDILRTHDQIILWVSGHTHYRLGPGEACQKNGVTFVGLGATSYLPDHEHGLSQDDLEECQCRVLEIYDTYLKVRARDLKPGTWAEHGTGRGRWLDNLELIVQRKYPTRTETEWSQELVTAQ